MWIITPSLIMNHVNPSFNIIVTIRPNSRFMLWEEIAMHSLKFMTISTRTDVLIYSFLIVTLSRQQQSLHSRRGSEIINTYCLIDFCPFSVNAWIRLCWSSRAEVQIDGRSNKLADILHIVHNKTTPEHMRPSNTPCCATKFIEI